MASNSAGSRSHTDAGPSPGPSSVESVIHMLETCQLTEEDTEALLADAYALNRRLKAELARLDTPGGGTAAGQTATAPPRRATSQLPPIRRHSRQRAVERQQTQMADLSRIYTSSGSGALGLASSGPQRAGGGTKAGRRRSAGKRPLERKEWQ